jgi:hypothetical protein
MGVTFGAIRCNAHFLFMKYLLIIAIVLFCSCEKDAEKPSIATSNGAISISMLFEHEGCKVYRFYDNGNAIYYTDCRGKVEYEYKTTTSTGKGQTTTTRTHVQNETSQ